MGKSDFLSSHRGGKTMQEVRSVTTSSNMTIKRPSGTSETGQEAETHGQSSGSSSLSSLQPPHGTDLLSLGQAVHILP